MSDTNRWAASDRPTHLAAVREGETAADARLRLVDTAIRAKQAASQPAQRALEVACGTAAPMARRAVPHRGRIVAGAAVAGVLLVIARRLGAAGA